MVRNTYKQRIGELEAMFKKPWYRTLELWSIVISIVAIFIAVSANKIALSNNKLEQASIRSSHINYCYNLIDEISNEIKYDTIFNSTLLNKFASHTYILEPFDHELENDGKTNKISPGRGILLNSIVNQKISKKSLEIIFNKSTFESSKLQGIKWDSVTIIYAKLAGSLIKNSNVSGSIIDSSDWNGSTFSDSKFEFDTFLNQCTFNQCLMTNVSFKGSVFKENVEFIDCSFNNVNFSMTNFINMTNSLLKGPFINCNLTCTKFDKVNFRNAKFNNCLWDGTTFLNCNLINADINISEYPKYIPFVKTNIQGASVSISANCYDYKIKLVNSIINKGNSLLRNEHFLKFHKIKDTLINNQVRVIANFTK
jgi:uncharacterized protein YjbI with pentapeptide repeats